MRFRARDAPAALLLLAGCAGSGHAVQRDLDALRAEVHALRNDNEDLVRRVDALTTRVEAMSARAEHCPAPATQKGGETAKPPVIPPDLAVVRVEPPAQRSGSARGSEPPSSSPRPARIAPPPVPTAVPISEPDSRRIAALDRRGGRDIGADADAELKRARQLAPAQRAGALEEFVARYPRHPSADNALVEASAVYADLGRADAACDLARRVTEDYPAGDAMSDALERLAWCESRRGAREAERRLLERLVTEFAKTPAAERAGNRLAIISGRSGETPEAPPSRSSK